MCYTNEEEMSFEHAISTFYSLIGNQLQTAPTSSSGYIKCLAFWLSFDIAILKHNGALTEWTIFLLLRTPGRLRHEALRLQFGRSRYG